jgi:hypothetical protein
MFLRFAPNDKPETGALSAAYPTQAQRQGLTPISCHAVLERSACAPFIKERRMKCINATTLRRKSGQWGTPTFVAGAGGRVIAPLTCHRQSAPRDDKVEGSAHLGSCYGGMDGAARYPQYSSPCVGQRPMTTPVEMTDLCCAINLSSRPERKRSGGTGGFSFGGDVLRQRPPTEGSASVRAASSGSVCCLLAFAACLELLALAARVCLS